MDPLTSLAGRLRVEPDRLAPLRSCTTEQLTRLDDLCRAAIEAEDTAVREGMAESLRVLPMPLRVAAKRLFMGGRR